MSIIEILDKEIFCIVCSYMNHVDQINLFISSRFLCSKYQNSNITGRKIIRVSKMMRKDNRFFGLESSKHASKLLRKLDNEKDSDIFVLVFDRICSIICMESDIDMHIRGKHGNHVHHCIVCSEYSKASLVLEAITISSVSPYMLVAVRNLLESCSMKDKRIKFVIHGGVFVRTPNNGLVYVCAIAELYLYPKLKEWVSLEYENV